MDGRTAEGAGPSDPAPDPARTELLRALLHERYMRQPFNWVQAPSAVVAQRRRILLGKDLRNG